MLRINAIIVPFLIGGGMIAAFAREIIIAHYFGISRDVEIFRIAYALPNLLSFSVGTAFVSVTVPLIIRTKRRGAIERQEMIGRLLILNVFIVSCVVIVGVLTGTWQAKMFAPGFDAVSITRLTVHIRWCWLLFLFVGLSFTVRAVLNTKCVFWPGASTNLIKAGTFIIILCLAQLCIEQTQFSLPWLTILSVFSGTIILIAHIGAAIRHRLDFSYRKVTAQASKKLITGIAFSLGAVMLYQVLNAVPTFIDRAYASNIEEGVVASLEYSYSLIIAVASILGTSFNTVMLPKFVKLIERKANWSKFRILSIAAGSTVFLTLLIGVFVSLFVEDIVRIIFMHGKFDAHSVTLTSSILRWQALGIGFMVASMMTIQILIVLGFHKRLILFGVIKVVMKIILIGILLPVYGIAGLGISFLGLEGAMFGLLSAVAYVQIRIRYNCNVKTM